MLPNEKKLEELLEKLFEENDGSTPDGVVILRKPGLMKPFSDCCSCNYGNYGG